MCAIIRDFDMKSPVFFFILAFSKHHTLSDLE